MTPPRKPFTPPWTLVPNEIGAPRILLLVAEFGLRNALERFLTEHGYDITTASGSDEAVAMLGSDIAFDAVVVDVTGPDAPGERVIEVARATAEGAALRVLALAERSGDRVDGADAVLPKEAALELVLERLSELMRNRHAEARPRSAVAIANLIAQLEREGDDPQGSARAAIAKMHQRDGNNEEAAYWFMCAATHAEACGNPKLAASWRTLANLIAPAGSQGRLAKRRVQ